MLKLCLAGDEMNKLFSARTRASTWRKLWLWLAEAEKELGLAQITEEALDQIRANLVMTDEDFQIAADEERKRRHDVMSALYALGEQAPKAKGILHIGVTSAFITDNADLIFIRDALDLILPKLAKVIRNLSDFALRWKDLPTLGFTHYQAAQPITMGKRACQWIHDMMFALDHIQQVRSELKFRGAQGTTGTQASFMEIFDGDTGKIDQLNKILCEKAGFSACYDISTQTYTRMVDLCVAQAVSLIGVAAEHFANDIRLLAHDKVLDEPHESTQVR
jgi:adenylosuccinate lyase